MTQAILELAAAIDRLTAAMATSDAKKDEKGKSPRDPQKEKEEKNTHTPRARVRKAFTPPTLGECAAYAAKKGMAIDVAHFYDHYTANGWKVSGRAPVKDWQAAMRNWERRDKSVRPLTVYERKRAEFELEQEARDARKDRARNDVIATLTEDDWQLCREAGCRHCTGRKCKKGCALPPDHRLNDRPCRPDECPHFEKGGAR